jgi:soluble lytic murein transglycosylase-like protein
MVIPAIPNSIETGLSGRTARLEGGADGRAPAKPRRTLTDEAEIAKAQKACREFESIFIQKLLSSMREAFESEEEDKSDFGGDLFKSMMDEHLSIALAKAGGIGLARLMAEGLGIESESPPVRPPLAVPPETGYGAYQPANARPGLEAYQPAIESAAADSGLSANLIKAVILEESGGNRKAVSAKGAKGLMQLMDETARQVGVGNPFNPVENIRGGARYLAGLVREFKGDLELALASYNAGIGNVRKYGGIPPFRETQDYVKKVMATLGRLDSSSGG